ncbi:CidA/LrgA family protein [Geomicrobium sp. JCM 19038]|uniref:CidA/LrgA family protein n=2 Tax=unclassified Geomicrobium TaxID=2628951 RepID=UPI0005A86DEF|nr:CidA/LrgA family protein [Geomicrobium sp. JCM 19038]
MKVVKDFSFLLLQLAVLVLFYFIGMMMSSWIPFPIPGSVIGMLLLLLCLQFKVIKIQWVKKGATLLIVHMPLLFIPILAGLIQHLDLLRAHGLTLVAITALSTWIVLATASLLSQWLLKKQVSSNE